MEGDRAFMMPGGRRARNGAEARVLARGSRVSGMRNLVAAGLFKMLPVGWKRRAGGTGWRSGWLRRQGR